MKALILASGIGKRLRPMTYKIPKSLIKIHDKTILDHQIDNLVGCKIRKIIITTGHFEDEVRMHVSRRYPKIEVSYVNNPKYNTTDYIYSLWLTRELIDDDMILIHGDLLFEKRLLEGLIEDEHKNCVLVNKGVRAPEKDFKAIIENGRVSRIGVEFSGDNAFQSMPLYKFSKQDFLYWLEEIGKFIEMGNTKNYAEDVFNMISDKVILHPLYFKDRFCMEIDDINDLNAARDYFSSQA